MNGVHIIGKTMHERDRGHFPHAMHGRWVEDCRPNALLSDQAGEEGDECSTGYFLHDCANSLTPHVSTCRDFAKLLGRNQRYIQSRNDL